MPDTIAPIAARSHDAWPETDPSLLEEGRPALPDFPLQSLPPWWRAWVGETAHGAGAPVDYIAQALLASVAGVCGAGVLARVTETWREPMILWQALVGGPSNGKTPALEALRRPLAAVEKTLAPEKRGPTVIDHDANLPALLAAASKRPAGALLWRDEPAAWLAALGCNGRGEPRQLSALLDTWSPLRTALGPGSPAISIIGCLDPARLDTALSGSDDGRAARFLYAWPQPAPYRSFLELPPCRESDAVSALQRIVRIAGDPDRPLAVALDEQALRQLDGHLARLHGELQRCDGVEAAWLGKGRGTVVRLALALALLDWAANASATVPQPRAVTGEQLSAACRLWDYFRAHARAVLTRAFPSDGERLMRKVLGWIHTCGAAQISREDVRRDALAQALNAHQSLQVIGSLERAGFLRKVVVQPDGAGRPALRWEVNPVVIGGSLAEIAEIPPPDAGGDGRPSRAIAGPSPQTAKETDMEAKLAPKMPQWMVDHANKYLSSGGKEGHIYKIKPPGYGDLEVPALLLTTTGRKSGEKFIFPLFYGDVGNGYVIVASKGGAPEHPGWYKNILGNPEVEVQVGTKKVKARARTATGAERAKLWEQAVKFWPPYTDYQKKTDREIPVVVLDPVQ